MCTPKPSNKHDHYKFMNINRYCMNYSETLYNHGTILFDLIVKGDTLHYNSSIKHYLNLVKFGGGYFLLFQ